MKQPLYIKSAIAISPQHSFDPEQFLKPVATSDNGKLFAIDTDYSKFISPVAIRRMSRLIKMGISAGMKCIRNAGITQPDAIITGTGRGSVTDMEHFLKDMISLEEQAMNPTYFIQSTYNSVNGWLALQTKATCYNQTYVHRGFSFELTLFDAQLLLQEADGKQHLLIGCFDELTEEYYIIKSKRGYWKKEPINNLELLKHTDTPGAIAGEGVTFFVVSNNQEQSACAVHDIKMLQNPSAEELQQAIDILLQENNLTKEDLDIFLCGMNGDHYKQLLYNTIINDLSDNTTVATFKHLCGEYDTSGGFGLWLANYIFSEKQLPEAIVYKAGSTKTINNLLICNHSIFDNVSLTLVKNAN